MLARRLTTIQQHVEFVASGLRPGAGGAGGDAELPPVLLRRIRRHPETTVISINAINRRIWVRHIMEVRYGFHFMHFSPRSSISIVSCISHMHAMSAGVVREARDAGGADDAELDHGVHRAGLRGHHAELPRGGAHGQRHRPLRL
jgi:hypothetical protein